MRTMTILYALAGRFEKHAEKMSKHYKREFKYSMSKPYFCADENSAHYEQEVCDVTFDDNSDAYTFRINGWRFLAILEWDDFAGVNRITRCNALDDIAIPEEYRTSRRCDHCGTNRKRNKTILLLHEETQEMRQVGASCVKEYTGVDLSSYAQYLALWETLEQFEEQCEAPQGMHIVRGLSTKEVLAQAYEEIRLHGFVSTTDAFENAATSTAEKVYDRMLSANGRLPVQETTRAKAIEVREWFAGRTDDSDYFVNLRSILASDIMHPRNVGIVCSAFRTMERTIEREAKLAERKQSEWMGQVGAKLTITAVPKYLWARASDFGTVYCWGFNVDGNELIWKTGKWLEADKEITLTGTVKEHGMFREVKQTELTRCRVKEVTA